MRLTLLMLLVPALGYADQTVPAARPPGCSEPPPAVLQEVQRMLKSAGEHATHSDVCSDGDGERVDLKLLEACRVPRDLEDMEVRVWIRYRAITTYEVGGECTPYPKCAEAPPPSESTHSTLLGFVDVPPGLKLGVPATLPGVTFKTPLHKKHSTGCHGDRPPFESRYVSAAGKAAAIPAEPKATGCMPPMPSVVAEVKRLLTSAGEHASHSSVCADGIGNTLTVHLLSACIAKPLPLTLSVRYRVSTLHESGGECAGGLCGAPSESHQDALGTLTFNHHPDGMRIALPDKLPAVPLKTPLARKHSTGCNGEKAAFLPKVISSK